MQRVPAGTRSTSNNHSPPATAATSNKNDDLNFTTQSKYKKFTDFLKESKLKQQKKTNKIECNCWVCKILDSSISATNNETDTTTTKRYEPYNIISETGDSIFYDPFLSNIFNDNDDKLAGEIYVSKTAIEEVVNRIIDHQKRLGSSLNNIKNGN